MPWQIDTSHSRVGFAVKHMMVATVRGEFKTYTGTLDLNTDDLTQSRISGEIEVASIETRDEQRDGHLRSGDFFDAENHPKITFNSTRIVAKGGNAYTVYGDLTIRGITREVTLDAEYGLLKDPWGNSRASFSATGTLDRKDFGLVWNVALEAGGILVGDQVKLELEAQAIPQVAPVAATVG